jgi:PAS domain S-box-containing protein
MDHQNKPKEELIRELQELQQRYNSLETAHQNLLNIEDTLHKREDRFRTLSSFTSEGLMIHDNGIILDANLAFAQILGYTSVDELIGKNGFETIMFTEESKLIVKEIIMSKSDETYHIIIQNLEGIEIPVATRGIDISYQERKARLVYMRDISVQKKSELLLLNKSKEIEDRNKEYLQLNEELTQTIRKLQKAIVKAEENEAKYRLLAENSNDIVWLMDLNLNYIYLSPSAEKLFGYSMQEQENIKSGLIFDEGALNKIYQYLNLKIQEYNCSKIIDKLIFELEGRHKDGHTINLEISAVFVFGEDGNIKGIQGTSRDISERKKIELDLIKAKEKAEESNNLKTAFLNNISHEVRTPLNGIVGFSQLMSRPGLTSLKIAEFAVMLDKSTVKLIEMITDIIEISEISANVISARLSEFELLPLINLLSENFQIKAQEKNINFFLNTYDLPPKYSIKSDIEKFKKIFNHLVDNAVKFTTDGSIAITCEIAEEYLQLIIADTGIGISEEIQKFIFEPFRQAAFGRGSASVEPIFSGSA